MRSFVEIVCVDQEVAEALSQLLDSVDEKIHEINAELVGNDFEQAEQI